MNTINSMINIGFGNMVCHQNIICIVNPDSAPIKRLIAEYKERMQLIDATCGRRTRSVIVTNSGFIILSSLLPETISQRIASAQKESLY